MFSFIDKVPLTFFIAISLSLGLAPFFPEPHIWEKMKMIAEGTLTKPVDIFDFLFHGLPWMLLTIKLFRLSAKK